jgi:membrane protein implicated in regulation of membrane protease activity
MRQTILSVVLDVDPRSAAHLSALIEDFKLHQEQSGAESYSRLKDGVPSLHFLSMSVFEDAHYDPIFVIEANFDGLPGPFWAHMEATLADHLRPMLRCCKRPADSDGPAYDAVTKPNSRDPVVPYLQRRTLRPSVFHQGNRGLERDRILGERDLFLAIRDVLAQTSPSAPNPYRGVPTAQIHVKLRSAMLARFPWLAAPAPTRISWAERAADLCRLLSFLFATFLCLSIPGMAIAPVTPAWRFAVLVAVLAGLVAIGLWRMHEPRDGEGVPTRSGGLTAQSLSLKNKITSFANPITLMAGLLLVIALYVIAATVIGSFVIMLMTGLGYPDALRPTARVVVLGFASIAFTAPAIVLWLRWLERRDSSHDEPPVDRQLLREMARREDWIAQNHMGSVVLVKPGVLRTALFRAGHLGLGLVLRAIATNGYLGSMRTVHFAHWAFVNNGSRLMFFSNFDHSWESYLDDFIEKAHGGLTLAWGSGVGFPPTRFLVLDGASHGRKFKAWARHSMAVSRFWFSAYRDLTVDQIERNARIADGLRKARLTPQEAEAWVRDL